MNSVSPSRRIQLWVAAEIASTEVAGAARSTSTSKAFSLFFELGLEDRRQKSRNEVLWSDLYVSVRLRNSEADGGNSVKCFAHLEDADEACKW